MNKNQKIVLCIGMILFVLIGLFPDIGFSFEMPTIIFQYYPVQFRQTAFKLLIIWIMITVVTSGLIVLLKDKKTK